MHPKWYIAKSISFRVIAKMKVRNVYGSLSECSPPVP